MAQAGIELNGSQPGDLRVLDSRLYRRLALNGTLGFGNAYLDGWFECDQMDIFFHKICRHMARRGQLTPNSATNYLRHLATRIYNMQSRGRAFMVARKHYNLGNELFSRMLDSGMNYSCGYWKEAKDLEEAQQAKLRLVFDKLRLEPGMKLLDIGMGWGGAAKFAVEHYGVEVTGVTVSQEQFDYVKKDTQGMPITPLLKDYRDIEGHYDRVYSIGMFEHVGARNYHNYLRVVRQVMEEDGLFLLHTIGGNFAATGTDSWIAHHIFPNGCIPSPKQLSKAIERNFIIEDLQNFGPDYDRTLMAWYHNVETHLEHILSLYDERFWRMWRYYLMCCAGAFRARRLQLWQLVLSPLGAEQRYDAPR